MNWVALLVGVAAGMAVAFGRVYAERAVARHFGLVPQLLFKHRDVLVPFLVLATAANIYAVWITVAYGGISAWRLSALVGMGLLVAAQMMQLHIALRPSRHDLQLALLSCAPYVYLFALYIAALATGRYSLWLF
ncbi:hypothetical protein [Pyrobaculum neutrophilum]|uniref:Uncharacterized protein n=1 Tax=Pyrobaculum neutrophilum (strain DSM 2338 / JCM 9278 / NBRC 100436 / V24Sta) TaxID=444157 RepID=B1YD79_PYRNV|nr:hypothetical protein [Pyrobaculum neutrophilum]ACB39742.1 conserved hypothetical protein [Pyrobaculum neutrophilum V24Sta]